MTSSVPQQPQPQPQDEEEDQAELMLRLQSQFGDLDLSHLLTTTDEPASACDANNNDDEPSSSDESSLAEPSPEELKAWQESQFQKGHAVQQAQRREKLGAVQRRREALQKQRARNAHVEEDDDDDDNDWEQVAGLPDLQGQSSFFFPTTTAHDDDNGTELVGVHPLLQQLAREGDPDVLGTAWHRLYSSADGDGLSFVHLVDKLHGYPGPTVLLIGTVPSTTKRLSTQSSPCTTTTTTGTVGFYTTAPWTTTTTTTSTTVTDSSDCFLFAFDDHHDTIQFFRPTPKDHHHKNDNPHYLHCHLSTTSSPHQGSSTDGAVHGLGIGGSPSQPRLHVTESLEECRALPYCRWFEAGDLLLGRADDALQYFDVDGLEVWAVGGKEWIHDSLQEQQTHFALTQAQRVQARKVDKQQFLRDFQGGLLSLSGDHHQPSGLFAHHGHTTDRCDL